MALRANQIQIEATKVNKDCKSLTVPTAAEYNRFVHYLEASSSEMMQADAE